MSAALALLAAYLIGSVPFGWLVSRLTGRGDIRQQGSGNIGATNVARVLGPRLGAAVLVLDAGKGVAAVAIGRAVAGQEPWPAACGLAVMAGHVFPVTLGFHGGKGVATGLGVFLCLTPYPTLVAGGVFAAVVAATRYVSLGSLLASLALVAAVFAERGWGAPAQAALAGTLLIWLRHASNLRRLARGDEPRLGAQGS